MKYVVAHFRKVKNTGGLAAVAIHNSRGNVLDETGGFREDPPVWMKNPLRIGLNEGQQGKRDDSIQRLRARVIREAELARKPQKNAAEGIEAVFSASAGSFKNDDQWKEYFKACREWVEKKFGHQNILQWNTHYDETTPHMHVLMVPIIYDQDRGNRYSSSEFLGGREGLREIQTEIYEQVGRPRGLERGTEGSKARHNNQVEWAKELREKEEALKEKEKELERNLGVSSELVKKMALFYKNWTILKGEEIIERGEAVKKVGVTLGEFIYRKEEERKQQQREVQKPKQQRDCDFER